MHEAQHIEREETVITITESTASSKCAWWGTREEFGLWRNLIWNKIHLYYLSAGHIDFTSTDLVSLCVQWELKKKTNYLARLFKTFLFLVLHLSLFFINSGFTDALAYIRADFLHTYQLASQICYHHAHAWPHGLLPISLLCPLDFSGKNIGMNCHFFLQGLNLGLLSCRQILFWLSHLWNPTKWIQEYFFPDHKSNHSDYGSFLYDLTTLKDKTMRLMWNCPVCS